MAWFRRHVASPPPAEDDPADSPAALLQALDQLVAFINQNAGKLPGESVVAARRVTDTVRDVIDTSDDGELDVYAIISVKGIVNDYLPTTLRTYLAAGPAGGRRAPPTGRTPKESLLDQIISLWAARRRRAHRGPGEGRRRAGQSGQLPADEVHRIGPGPVVATMKRGANVALTREIPGLTGVVLGVSWNAGAETALTDNLVFAAILTDKNNRALSDEHFVFFNQLSSPDLSVQQLEEALGGDQEQIEIDLARFPPNVDRIVVVLYVNDGPAQRRTLGQLRGCALCGC